MSRSPVPGRSRLLFLLRSASFFLIERAVVLHIELLDRAVKELLGIGLDPAFKAGPELFPGMVPGPGRAAEGLASQRLEALTRAALEVFLAELEQRLGALGRSGCGRRIVIRSH